MRKLMRSRVGHRSTRPRFPFKKPLMAALMACSFLSCDPKLPERPPPPKIPPAAMKAPVKKEPMIAIYPAMKAPKKKKAKDKPTAKKKPKVPCGKFCFLHAKGYPEAAPILHKRTTQGPKKMKLTFEQGKHAAAYLIKDLPSMFNAVALLAKMPKTTIELVRSVNERDVTKKDSEEMADYLLNFLKSMKILNLSTFDECISHMIGREWPQIDYSGENMTWQSQRKFYNRKKLDWVKDIKTRLHLHRFFQMEVKMRYFKRLFAPQGKLPKI